MKPSLLYRSRCSSCGKEGLSPVDGIIPPCNKCGGQVFLFKPGPWVFRVFIILMSSSAFGFIYWYKTQFIPITQGKVNFVPGNIIAMSEFVISMAILISASAAAICAIRGLRGSIKLAILSAIFAIASFGYWISVILSVLAILMILKYRNEFYA